MFCLLGYWVFVEMISRLVSTQGIQLVGFYVVVERVVLLGIVVMLLSFSVYVFFNQLGYVWEFSLRNVYYNVIQNIGNLVYFR